MDISEVSSYKVVVWYTDLLRGYSRHTLFVMLLAIQFLVPPTWVKHGLDCLQRCRLAATTGAHCPLMEGERHTKPSHHCHEQTAPPSSSELRCHCSPSSSPSSALDVIRFVLPPEVTVSTSALTFPPLVDPVVRYVDIWRTPPDPPPRSLLLSVL